MPEGAQRTGTEWTTRSSADGPGGCRADVEFGVAADAYRSDRDRRSSRLGAVALQIVFGLALFAAVLAAWWGVQGSIGLLGLVVAVVVGLAGLS